MKPVIPLVRLIIDASGIVTHPVTISATHGGLTASGQVNNDTVVDSPLLLGFASSYYRCGLSIKWGL